MPEIPTRRRPLALLVIVTMAQVLLLAFQVRHVNRAQRADVPLIRFWAAELITPIERAGTWTLSKIGRMWSGYIGLRAARTENFRLHAENDELKLRNRELETQAGEAQRLENVLKFVQAHPEAPMSAGQVVAASTPMVAAQVIGASADPNSHTVFINRGERDHIRRNMGVITPDGIVGKIVEVFPGTAQVQLIDDKDSGVGALFLATRTHGVLKGPDIRTGDQRPRMEYIVNDEKVQAGDVIVTSGEDRIFPKGLPIGVVADAMQANPFQIIHVRTAARLDRLEDVLVLLTLQELKLKTVEELATPLTNAVPGVSSKQPAQSTTPQTAKPGAPQH